jgi:CHAD domain-containing protein
MGFRRSFRDTLALAQQEWETTRRRLLSERDPKALHRFRLLVKRLRAYRHWLRPAKGAKRTWRRLRQTYRMAGQIRDQALLGAVPEAFAEKAWRRLRRLLRRLSPRDRRLFTRTLRQRLARLPHPRRNLGQYIRKRIARVHTLRTHLPDEMMLHRIRRELKELRYLQQALVADRPNDQAAQKFLLWLNDRQEQLGEWHDALIRSQATSSAEEPAPQAISARIQVADLEREAIRDLSGLDQFAPGKRKN